ncbi:hypothetical protein [Thauera aromatica]|uniref:Uncharacterized protein n=1 Tax=Thauera aromatica K172 TaxID=44139 RepID=A0A2R4BQW5_THAAR|nr:hypothetical protein [Thauera aromatica]AVR89741.1 hypothetical protein Tharo_2859 [Thauera aromatica K172]
MFPLFPFAAGVLAGAVALRLLKNERTRSGLEKAQDRLRGATVSSLEAIEHASARAREKLAAAPAEAADRAAPGSAAAAAGEAAAPAARKPAPRRRKPKAAVRPAAPGEESPS